MLQLYDDQMEGMSSKRCADAWIVVRCWTGAISGQCFYQYSILINKNTVSDVGNSVMVCRAYQLYNWWYCENVMLGD